MKNKFLSSCSQGNYRDSLGDFINASYGVFGAERLLKVVFWGMVWILHLVKGTAFQYFES